MNFNLDDTLDILSRTPAVLRAMLERLPERWTHASYGPDTFSPFDVVGHLIHGERTDWIPRARVILERGEAKPFEPFDRYAMFEASRGSSMAELLDTFESERRAGLEALRAMRLSPADLAKAGRHPDPALGRVTLAELLSAWTVHDLHHLAQIAKAMSFQYAEATGPWRAYLSILPRVKK